MDGIDTLSEDREMFTNREILQEIRAMREDNRKDMEKLNMKMDQQYQVLKNQLEDQERKWQDTNRRLILLENSQTSKVNVDFDRKCENMESFLREAQEENILMRERLMNIERGLDRQETQKRKLNILIKGLKLISDNITGDVENLLSMKFNLKGKVTEAHIINNSNQVILVRIADWDSKMVIMRTKKTKLVNTDIFIENDLTPRERKINSKHLELSKQARLEGRSAVLGYQKIRIEGQWLRWDINKDKLVPIEKERPLHQRENTKNGMRGSQQ